MPKRISILWAVIIAVVTPVAVVFLLTLSHEKIDDRISTDMPDPIYAPSTPE